MNRKEWMTAARREARRIAKKLGTVTVDDVREKIAPPEDADPRCMGAIFMDKKMFKRVGYTQSKRTECHNRPIGVFRLRDAA